MPHIRHIAWATLTATVSAYAQSAPVQRADEVVVTASRFPEAERGPALTVIDRRRIEESTAQNIVELLAQEAGIHVRDSLGSPDWSIDLRGFGQTGDQNTLVLVDGVRFSEIDTTPAKWSGIPLAAVERIEVLRGNRAVLYGNGATAGVINIITRKTLPDAKQGDLLLRAGSWSSGEAQFALNLGGEAAGLSLAGGAQSTDNFRDNNQLTQYTLLADLRNLQGPHTVYLKLAADKQDLRNPGQLTLEQVAQDPRQTLTPFDYGNRNGARADLGGNFDLGFGELAGNLSWRQKKSNALVFDFGSTVDIETEYYAFLPRLRVPWRIGDTSQSLVLGADFEKADYGRNVTGSFFASETTAKQKTSAAYLLNRSQFTTGTTLILGGRTQRVETTISDPFLAPVDQKFTVNAWEATLEQRLGASWSGYLRASQGFRVAGVEETPFTTGPLQPQKSHDYELGVAWHDGPNRVTVNAFRINLDNEISFNPLIPFFGDNANLAPTRRQGLELEASGRVLPALDLFATWTYTDAEFRSGIYGGVDVAGRTVPLVPQWQFTAGGAWRITGSTLLSASFLYVNEQFLNNDFANALPARIGDYTTLDLKLSHAIQQWLLALEVRNLLDRDYFTYGGVNTAGEVKVFPAPERSIFASAEYRFR
ncbi:MAG TPA: TonB-dependent receptor [Burkholderiales bacterium]|nr:TonB-dependent receptor [Burkholderiales bacterium]